MRGGGDGDALLSEKLRQTMEQLDMLTTKYTAAVVG